jgi:hypothetical protein
MLLYRSLEVRLVVDARALDGKQPAPPARRGNRGNRSDKVGRNHGHRGGRHRSDEDYNQHKN